jgi:two-component sensor histidine kinase
VQYGQICQNVNILIEAEPCTLPVDTAIPCGLVINELVSNALKHAFPNERCGELRIKLHYANSDKITLEVTDNGVGLPQITELNHHKGFGMRLIELMVEDQMHGKLCISSSDTGTQIRCEIGEIK